MGNNQAIKTMKLSHRKAGYKLICLYLSIFLSCNNEQSDLNKSVFTASNNIPKDTLNKGIPDKTDKFAVERDTDPDFKNFYFRFHTDSIYQLNSIKFPLRGFNTDEEDEFENENDDKEYHWVKNKWVLMRLPDVDSTYSIIKTKTDSTYVEKISIPNSGYYIIREFKKYDGKWFLCFYGVHNL